MFTSSTKYTPWLFWGGTINGCIVDAWVTIELLDQYGLTKNIVVYVKNEGANLNTMIIALKLIINCEALGVM
jgi:hypothetical protein